MAKKSKAKKPSNMMEEMGHEMAEHKMMMKGKGKAKGKKGAC
jgi:hypothetical protein